MCVSSRHDREANNLPEQVRSSTANAKQAMFAGSKVLQALLKAGKIDPNKVHKHLAFLKTSEKEDEPPPLSSKRKLEVAHSSQFSSRKDTRLLRVHNAPTTQITPNAEDGEEGVIVGSKPCATD